MAERKRRRPTGSILLFSSSSTIAGHNTCQRMNAERLLTWSFTRTAESPGSVRDSGSAELLYVTIIIVCVCVQNIHALFWQADISDIRV